MLKYSLEDSGLDVVLVEEGNQEAGNKAEDLVDGKRRNTIRHLSGVVILYRI